MLLASIKVSVSRSSGARYAHLSTPFIRSGVLMRPLYAD